MPLPVEFAEFAGGHESVKGFPPSTFRLAALLELLGVCFFLCGGRRKKEERLAKISYAFVCLGLVVSYNCRVGVCMYVEASHASIYDNESDVFLYFIIIIICL